MDSVFFWISKIVWLILMPGNLLVLLSIAGLILLFKKAYRKATLIFAVLTLFIATIAFFPVGDWLLAPLETRFPVKIKLPEEVKGILVLGGADQPVKSAVWQQPGINHSAERFFAFIQMMKKYPDAKHVFSGGSGLPMAQQYKGADVARQLFQTQGLDVSKIIFEDQSRNTYENGAYTHALVNPLPNEKWILITSASHMPRSVGVFNKVGWHMIPYPVDHQTLPGKLFRISLNFSGNLYRLTDAVREWLGLLAYFATGKTTAVFPGP